MLPISLAIVGSRGFTNYPLLCRTMKDLCKTHKIGTIISGGASGADRLAERYANEFQVPIIVLKPVWRKNGVYNAGAGKERNTEIIALADYVLAFWDGRSAGTRDTITKTRRLGKKKWLKVVEYAKNTTNMVHLQC